MSHWNPPTQDSDHPAHQTPWLYFGVGIALAVGLHLVMGLAVAGSVWAVNVAISYQLVERQWMELAGILGMMWLAALSLVQILYLGPAWVLTHRWRPHMAQGIVVAAIITFLLQSSCYGFFCLALGA